MGARAIRMATKSGCRKWMPTISIPAMRIADPSRVMVRGFCFSITVIANGSSSLPEFESSKQDGEGLGSVVQQVAVVVEVAMAPDVVL